MRMNGILSLSKKLIQGTDMNLLSKCKGKVPVFTEIGSLEFKLVDFPDKGLFHELFKRTPVNNRETYWTILKSRSEGKTLVECGKPFGITKQRVNAIESKFIRLMSQHYFKQ